MTQDDAAKSAPTLGSPCLVPYYQRDGITIYHGDCREILPHLPGFDLLLTDPPYGIHKKAVRNGFMADRGGQCASEWDKRPTKETLEVVMASAVKRIIWGGNYLAGDLGDWKAPLVWDKQTGANYFADGEMAWSDVSGTLRIFRHQWCGAFKASERGSARVHPTQKPVALMSWCLGLVPDATTVLDPFMGSGTTLVAAKLERRQAVGIEVEERYCEIAANRLRNTVMGFF